MATLSQGHHEHPGHTAVGLVMGGRMTVELAGQCIADSRDMIRLEEDGRPAQFYFTGDDVQTQFLRRSTTTTAYPFKGTAIYLSVRQWPPSV